MQWRRNILAPPITRDKIAPSRSRRSSRVRETYHEFCITLRFRLLSSVSFYAAARRPCDFLRSLQNIIRHRRNCIGLDFCRAFSSEGRVSAPGGFHGITTGIAFPWKAGIIVSLLHLRENSDRNNSLGAATRGDSLHDDRVPQNSFKESEIAALSQTICAYVQPCIIYSSLDTRACSRLDLPSLAYIITMSKNF